MKIFLDEQLNGLDPLLRMYDYEVVTVIDEGLKEHNDEQLVDRALAKNYIFVTEDEGAMKIAKEKGAKYIFLDTVMKAKAVRQELETRYARELHN